MHRLHFDYMVIENVRGSLATLRLPSVLYSQPQELKIKKYNAFPFGWIVIIDSRIGLLKNRQHEFYI